MSERYEVIEPIGSGGMATVWRAHDRELERMVAIKRPHPAPAGSSTHERFRREARAAAAVSHPNLVTVYDAAVDEDGPYLVMELVEAPSLAESVVAAADAAGIGASLAQALAALHASNIVHRDIKPANILLAPGGPQLTDFGIARSLGAADDVTRTGVNLGTPSYAPPESLAGGVHDESGDVYSLAVVIHEMFTGERFAPVGGTRVMVTDTRLRAALEPALAEDPTLRPTAAEFARSLETVRHVVDRDSTQVMSAGTTTPDPEGLGVDMIGGTVSPPAMSRLEDRWRTADRNGRGLAVLLAACASIAVVLLAIGLLRDDDPSTVTTDVGPAVSSETADVGAAPESVEESVVPSVVDPPSTVPEAPADDAVPAATEPLVDDIAPPAQETLPVPESSTADIDAARRDFDGFVSALPDDVLKDKEREKVLEDVGEALDDAGAGDQDDARKSFESAAKRLDKVSGDDARDRSLELLVRLADAVGVSIDV